MTSRCEHSLDTHSLTEIVLHNMSCRPNATLRRKPAVLARLVELAVPVALPDEVLGSAAGGAGAARAWLSVLGEPLPASNAACEQSLVEIIERAAAASGLPAVVPVTDMPADPLGGLSDRLDVVLAVIAKSSGSAYLAGAEPVVARLHRRPRITLVLPLGWSPAP